MGSDLIATSKKIAELYDDLFKSFGQSYNLMVCNSNNEIHIKLGDVFIPITNEGYGLCLDAEEPKSHIFGNTPLIKAKNIEEMLVALKCLGYCTTPVSAVHPGVHTNKKYRQIPLSAFGMPPDSEE